jgi:predicted outer membrane protein
MGYGYPAARSLAAATMTIALAAAACGGPNTPAPVAAQEGEPQQEVQAPASDEARFALALLSAAYQGEEELAGIATDRAQSPRVRAHAEDLQEDYERLEPQVDQVADQVDVDLEEAEGIAAAVANELGGAYQELGAVLEQIPEEDFDHTYLRSLMATHQATISELERIEDQIQEPEVRQLVQTHLPLIRRQLERTRDVAQREGLQV